MSLVRLDMRWGDTAGHASAEEKNVLHIMPFGESNEMSFKPEASESADGVARRVATGNKITAVGLYSFMDAQTLPRFSQAHL